MYVRQALDLLEGLITADDSKEITVAHLQKLIVFAIMWSLGALLELDDRKKVRIIYDIHFSLFILLVGIYGRDLRPRHTYFK